MNPFRFPSTCRRPRPSRESVRRLRLASIFSFAVFLVAALLLTQAACADEGLLRGPRRTVRGDTESVAPHQGIVEQLAAAPVLFYQRFLGPHWARRCSYYPSCSNYALLAIRKHGAFVGSFMAFDRLQHEADEGRHAPQVLVNGEIKLYDPLENNDYWWYTPARPGPATPADTDRGTTP